MQKCSLSPRCNLSVPCKVLLFVINLSCYQIIPNKMNIDLIHTKFLFADKTFLCKEYFKSILELLLENNSTA